jgi:hypothetical protein
MKTDPMVSPRRLTVALATLVAMLAALLTACSSTSKEPPAAAAHHPAAAAHYPAAAAVTADRSGANGAEAAFHDAMRKLWEQHVAWTRLAIVDFASGSDGFPATAARLMQNQVDIGNAIKPYYGAAAGNQLTKLLHEHIAIAVEVMQTAKAGDTAGFKSAKARWYANANSIADFLATADPKHWPQDMMRQMMKVHLDQTLTEASDELTGKYAASAAEYDQIETHILEMADGLSAGIIAAFPNQFH